MFVQNLLAKTKGECRQGERQFMNWAKRSYIRTVRLLAIHNTLFLIFTYYETVFQRTMKITKFFAPWKCASCNRKQMENNRNKFLQRDDIAWFLRCVCAFLYWSNAKPICELAWVGARLGTKFFNEYRSEEWITTFVRSLHYIYSLLDVLFIELEIS